MPRISSNLETTKAFTPVPDGWYKAHPITTKYDEKEGRAAIMLGFDWEIDGAYGDDPGADERAKFKGRKINFDNVLVGGVNPQTNEPYSIGRLLSYLDAMQVSYECSLCSTEQVGANKKGNQYYCPGCDQVLANVAYDTEAFQNKPCAVEIGHEQQKKNEIDPNTGKTVAKPQFDENGAPLLKNLIKRVKKLD